MTVRSGMAFVVSRAQRTLLSPSTVAAIVSSCRFVSFRSQALKTQHERAKQCERERERDGVQATLSRVSVQATVETVSLCACVCVRVCLCVEAALWRSLFE